MNGRNQAVRIPREMKLPGKEVLIHKEGTKLIIEPIDLPLNLLDVLSGLSPIGDQLPDVDSGFLPLDDIRV
jgi:antitoxin VapB